MEVWRWAFGFNIRMQCVDASGACFSMVVDNSVACMPMMSIV